jgi:hypothetical protein
MIDRLMKRYKNYAKNFRYIEGSIAEAYLVDESVTYCMEYMTKPRFGTHKHSQEEWLDVDDEYADEKPLDKGKNYMLNNVQFKQARRWVFNALADSSDWEE